MSERRARAFRLIAEAFVLLAEAEGGRSPAQPALGSLRTRVQGVLDESSAPLAAQEIARRLGANLDAVRAALSRSLAAGRVKRIGRDRYQAAPAPA